MGTERIGAPALVRSVLSWLRAVALNGTPPYPCALLCEVDWPAAATIPAVAKQWAAFLGSSARNISRLIHRAVPTTAEDHVVMDKLRLVLDAIEEARAPAEEHLAHVGEVQLSVPFVRSLHHWQWAILGAIAHPTPFGLIAGVDLEAASVNTHGAVEWLRLLEATAEKLTKLMDDAAILGVACPLINAEGMLNSVTWAHECAEEHVTALERRGT